MAGNAEVRTWRGGAIVLKRGLEGEVQAGKRPGVNRKKIPRQTAPNRNSLPLRKGERREIP